MAKYLYILITSRSKGNICKYIYFFELFTTHSFTTSNSNLFFKGKRTSILGLCTTKEAIGQPDGICCRAIGTRGVKGAIPSPQIWAITSLSKTHYIEKPSFSAYPFKFSYLPTALCSWTKLMESRLTKMHVCWVCRNREKNTFFSFFDLKFLDRKCKIFCY